MMRQSAWLPIAAVCIVIPFVGCQSKTQTSAPKPEAFKPVATPAATASAPRTSALKTTELAANGPRLVAPAINPTESPHSEAAHAEPAHAEAAHAEPAHAETAPAEPAHAEPAKKGKAAGPQTRTAFYRADKAPAAIPRVLMSKGNEASCRVKVGDTMPAIALPKIGGGGETNLADLFGKKATVVVFWKSDRRMALQELSDLGPDVIEPFGQQGVTVVGIAVKESDASAQAELKKAGASLTNLLDADGKAFAQVGSGKLPRTYVLDPAGKILWFDIEYSLATRRELHQTLRAVAGNAGSRQE